MAGRSLKMTRIGHNDIVDISNNFKKELNSDLVFENWRYVNDVRIINLTFEKFYWRTGGYAGLTILLTESNLIQTADVVGFAGGEGIFNLNMGVNNDFVENAKKVLSKQGFSVE